MTISSQDFSSPSCNTFLDPSPKVLLCFAADTPSSCFSLVTNVVKTKVVKTSRFLTHFPFSFDGGKYDSVESSKYSHQNTHGLGNYKGKALTTGCYKSNADCSFATEILDMNTMKWSDGPDYPFGSK